MKNVAFIIVCFAGTFLAYPQNDNKTQQGSYALDSIDIGLIKSSFNKIFLHTSHIKYRDTLTQKNNIYVLDSLIERDWLPMLTDLQFVFVSAATVQEIVKQRMELTVIRFGGVFNSRDLRSKEVEIIEMDCSFSRKYQKVVMYTHKENIYKYKLIDVKWVNDGEQMVIHDYAPIN